MKTVSTYLRALAATALVAAGLSTPAQAIDLVDNFDATEGRTQPASAVATFAADPAGDNAAQPPAPPLGETDPGVLAGCQTCGPNCNNCGHGCGQCCDGMCLPWCSEECPNIGFISSGGFEAWRGVSDAASEGNFGYVSSMNIAFPLVRDFGIAGQFGMSHGVYDWMGRTSNGNNEANQVQQQLMFTYGFFRRACGTRFQGGFVQDWMVNDNFGTLSQEPTLSQFRAQIGFVMNECNEFGVNLTHRDRSATQNFFNPVIPVTYSAISYTNLYWHRKWCEGGTDSWIWWGVPAYRRLNPAAGGSIGEFILGGALNVPVTSRIAAYANLNYMKPSAAGGIAGSTEEYFDLGFGLSFIPGGSRTRNVTGQRWMPLMPVANNGSFMVDRSL
ncbi:MAG: hypothetical protein JNM18_22005 [Planctomycetaceae bacterium]|nr:hypothetical protein [Planctomycetaceae bacterium]